MNNLNTRRLEMLKRVQNFGQDHNDAFPQGSFGRELLDAASQVVAKLESHGATQLSGHSAAQNLGASKETLREELREQMSAINRTARVMALTTPEFESKFRLPRNVSDQTWLNAAHAFALDGAPLKEHFIKHGLPTSFIDQLNQTANDFAQAISQRAAAVNTRVTSGIVIDEQIARGLQLVRQLDVLIRNLFHGDPVTLSSWTRSSHVVRRTRNHTPDTPEKPGDRPIE